MNTTTSEHLTLGINEKFKFSAPSSSALNYSCGFKYSFTSYICESWILISFWVETERAARGRESSGRDREREGCERERERGAAIERGEWEELKSLGFWGVFQQTKRRHLVNACPSRVSRACRPRVRWSKLIKTRPRRVRHVSGLCPTRIGLVSASDTCPIQVSDRF